MNGPIYGPGGEWLCDRGSIEDPAAAVDAAGNIIVSGGFWRTVTFGRGEPNETTLVAQASGLSFFVAKYGPGGELLWARQDDVERGWGVPATAVDAAGNIITIGSYRGLATFGEGEAEETVLASNGYYSNFAAKYDPDGNLLWAKTMMAGGFPATAFDAGGNIILSGTFEGSATFGAGERNETTLTSTGRDLFVASYASNGELNWARRDEGPMAGRGSAVAVDAVGNIVISGIFYESATFGEGDPNETQLTAIRESRRHTFVAKYRASPLDVDVFVRPGTCVAPLNVQSRGVLPVVVLGSDILDVTQIDVKSLSLEGVAPMRWSLEDLGGPENCAAAGPDGRDDLVLHFATRDVVRALGEVDNGDRVPLYLAGTLTIDGAERDIEGEDEVLIRGRPRPRDVGGAKADRKTQAKK